MKEGIILDVDVTLWNAVGAIRDSWNLYREEQIPEMPGCYTDADIEGGETDDENRDSERQGYD